MNSLKEQPDHHFQYSILIDNSNEKVWNFLTKVDRWKEWDTELKNAQLNEPFLVGARGVLIPKKGPKLKFHISEIIPHRSYTFITKMPVGSLMIKRTLTLEGSQIEFTDDIQFTGFLKQLLGKMLGTGFKSVLPEVMKNFKTLAEKE